MGAPGTDTRALQAGTAASAGGSPSWGDPNTVAASPAPAEISNLFLSLVGFGSVLPRFPDAKMCQSARRKLGERRSGAFSGEGV